MNRVAGTFQLSGIFFNFFFFILAICFVSNSTAQQVLQGIEIPSSPNPVGSGARALGMGGAFIAIADDATAASWNPGGLIQLEKPEISVVGAYFDRTEDNEFGTNPEASGTQDVSEGRINYLSAVYPFSFWGRNMVVSISHQNLYDFERNWWFSLNQATEGITARQNVNYDQDGSLSAIGLSYCIQINPKLSFGFTLNFWEDGLYDNEWKQNIIQKWSGDYRGDAFTAELASHGRYSFSGFNANLGILYNITNGLTIGVVFKTPFTADIEHESTLDSSIAFPSNPENNYLVKGRSTEDEELDMPMSYGLGLAYRFSDKLSASIDIYRTEWGDFVYTDYNDNKTSPISGKSTEDSEIDPTLQVRAGFEYLFINPKYVIPLRGGFFYDPAPAENNPDDFYGFSIGSGITKQRFAFDLAYQYRFGRNVGDSILENLDFAQDVDEQMIYSSIIVYF